MLYGAEIKLQVRKKVQKNLIPAARNNEDYDFVRSKSEMAIKGAYQTLQSSTNVHLPSNRAAGMNAALLVKSSAPANTCKFVL